MRLLFRFSAAALLIGSFVVLAAGPASAVTVAGGSCSEASPVAANGAGLAAIQVGVPVRLFIVDGHVTGGAEDSPPKVFINPEIVEISDEAQTGDEGCLSFPDIFVPVKRGMRAKVRARDLDGNVFEAEGEGLFARALQHETDHLNGRLLIDQVGPVKRELIKRKLRKDAEAEREEREDAAGADSKRSVG